MTYLEWVDAVLVEMDRAVTDNPGVALMGFDHREMVASLGLESTNECLMAVDAAFDDLALTGCAVDDGHRTKVTQQGQQVARAGGLRAGWKSFFEQCQLLDEDKEVLAKVVELGVKDSTDGYATTELVEMREVLSAVGRTPDPGAAIAITRRLEQLGCFGRSSLITSGSCKVRPSYVGIVIATKQVATELHSLLDDLVQTWETTSVDFKEAVKLDADRDKAEFCKDILALANTLASGRSFLVIGFADRSREFTTSVDPKCDQHRMESILAAYCVPVPTIRYSTVDLNGGSAGLIEVLPDKKALPYRLRRDVGKFKANTVFVRHNTLAIAATSDEEAVLAEQANWARRPDTTA